MKLMTFQGQFTVTVPFHVLAPVLLFGPWRWLFTQGLLMHSEVPSHPKFVFLNLHYFSSKNSPEFYELQVLENLPSLAELDHWFLYVSHNFQFYTKWSNICALRCPPFLQKMLGKWMNHTDLDLILGRVKIDLCIVDISFVTNIFVSILCLDYPVA